jgi:hypothetical protein
MKKQVIKSVVVLFVFALLLPSGVFAAEDQPQGGPQGGPPPEAFEVCKDKSAGDAVEITTPDGQTMEATCRDMQGQLVAMPAGGPPQK